LHTGLDGLLLRTWITNTGHVTENVAVTIDGSSVAFSSVQNPACTSVLGLDSTGAHTPKTPTFGPFTRNAAGALTQFPGTLSNVHPGDSYELYTFVAVDRTQFPCVDSSGHDYLKFKIVATGASGAFAQAQTEVRADTTEDASG